METKEKVIPYTDEERSILICLIDKYKHLVENKRTDATSNRKKSDAWVSLTKEYNANYFVSKRSVKQLKKCWEGVKCRRRKEERMRTGSGSPVGDCSIIPELEMVVRDDNPWDSDHISAADTTPDVGTHLVRDETGPVSATSAWRLSSTPTSTMLEESSTSCLNHFECRPTRCDLERELEARLRKGTKLASDKRELHELKLEEQRYLVMAAKLDVEKKELEIKEIRERIEMDARYRAELYQLKVRELRQKLEDDAKHRAAAYRP